MNAAISVLINTLNEERNIKECLEMLDWVDEIVVVDQCSDDKTVEIAKKYTDKIYFQERIGYASREYGYTKLTNEWIFMVDADELVSIELVKELQHIASHDLADVVLIPRKNYGFGELINYGRWNCLFDLQIRFGKKSFLILKDLTHCDFSYKSNSRVLKIRDPNKSMIHFTYLDFEQYVTKMNLYTTFEAENIFDGKKLKTSFLCAIYKAIRGFVKGYVVLKGYKDGYRGLAIHLLEAIFIVLVYIKTAHLNTFKTKSVRQSVDNEYKRIKNDIIMKYKLKTRKI